MKSHKKAGRMEEDTSQYQFCSEDSDERGFKFVLIVGRLIGVIPLSIGKGGIVKFRWTSLSAMHSLYFSVVGLVLLLPQLWECIQLFGTYNTILDEMLGLQGPAFQLSVLSVSIYYLKNSYRLINLFRQWSATMRRLHLTAKDTKFPQFCFWTTVIVLGMGVTENLLHDVYAIRKAGSSWDGNSLIEKLYKTGGRAFCKYIPHKCDALSLLFVYALKIGTYSWNFGDIFVMVLCRALSHKFREINQEIRAKFWEKMEFNEGEKVPEQSSHIHFLQSGFVQGLMWKEMRQKIISLCELTQEVASLVAPLVLACYGYNIFFIILNSLRFIYDPRTDLTLYVYVSTIQFAMRVVLVTYHASQVYHSTEEIFHSIELCPDYSFSPTAYRLERMLSRHPVGITIFGAVWITRKFFISTLSFLFTTEIVILQAMSATQRKSVATIA